MTATQPATVTATHHSGRRLYRDAVSLAAASLAAAGSGLAFWVIAARVIPPDQLGVQTALLAVATTPAIVVASGVGDVFTAFLPSVSAGRAAVVRRGYRLLVRMATPAALLAAIGAIVVLPQVRGSIAVGCAVFGTSIVWALFAAQDPALTAMGRAHWLPIENGLVGLGKLALLPVLTGVAAWMPVLVAAAVPALIAVLVLLPRVRRLASVDSHTGYDASSTPPRVLVREVSRFARRTTFTVLLSLGALTLLPFAVTAVAGARQGALFSLALSIVSCLDYVSIGLATSLVVQASAHPARAAAMAHEVLRRGLLLVGAAAVVLVLIAPLIVRALNPVYLSLHGVTVIRVLALTSIPRVISVVWVGLQQSRRSMTAVLRVNGVACVVLYAGVFTAGRTHGALGVATSLAAAQIVLTLGAAWQLTGERRRSHHVPRREVAA